MSPARHIMLDFLIMYSKGFNLKKMFESILFEIPGLTIWHRPIYNRFDNWYTSICPHHHHALYQIYVAFQHCNDQLYALSMYFYSWLGCRCCLPSVNTICGRILIGLSLLSSVSKHNMWSYYVWVGYQDINISFPNTRLFMLLKVR